MIALKSLQVACLSMGVMLVFVGMAMVLSRRIFLNVALTRREITTVALGAADLVLGRLGRLPVAL